MMKQRRALAAVGLDLEFVEGIHEPLQAIAGQTFYVDSITLRTHVEGLGRDVHDFVPDDGGAR